MGGRHISFRCQATLVFVDRAEVRPAAVANVQSNDMKNLCIPTAEIIPACILSAACQTISGFRAPYYLNCRLSLTNVDDVIQLPVNLVAVNYSGNFLALPVTE